MSVYCVCDSGIGVEACDCTGTAYEGKEGCTNQGACNVYTSACTSDQYGTGQDDEWNINYALCNTYKAENLPNNSNKNAAINAESGLARGNIIYKDEINTFWDCVNSLALKASTSLSIPKPQDMNQSDIIKATHLTTLKSNINILANPTSSGTYFTKTVITDVSSLVNALSLYETNYDVYRGSVINADDFKIFSSWIQTLEYFCVCVSHNTKVCCNCNHVCDCNY